MRQSPASKITTQLTSKLLSDDMFASKNAVLKPGCTILVTGVSGFVGSHVADQLLNAGYRVRGTTRDTTKSSWLVALFEGKYGIGKFELVSVPDLTLPGAFDLALKGIDPSFSVFPLRERTREIQLRG